MDKKQYLAETSILLPTRAASSGAAINKTEYVIVDGMTQYVYIFSFCGMFKGAIPTLRPYRKIVYSMETDSYYALGCSCNSVIYTLNCRFEETNKISAENSPKLTDISLTTRHKAEELLLSDHHSVSSYSKSGIENREIRKQNRCIFYKTFIETENAWAEGFEKNCQEIIRINVGEDEISVGLPSCLTLKNLFATDGGGIYAFLGKNYVNNYIVPLYENETINSDFFLKQSFNL